IDLGMGHAVQGGIGGGRKQMTDEVQDMFLVVHGHIPLASMCCRVAAAWRATSSLPPASQSNIGRTVRWGYFARERTISSLSLFSCLEFISDFEPRILASSGRHSTRPISASVFTAALRR